MDMNGKRIAILATNGFEQSELALQLRILLISESMGHHDSEIMDDGWLDRDDT